jgi:hypothetical protein
MDEIFNCYGLWEYPLFDEEGNLRENAKMSVGMAKRPQSFLCPKALFNSLLHV